MTRFDDDRVDRLLAHGHLSGPELDRGWARLRKGLPGGEPARSSAWGLRFAWVSAGLLVILLAGIGAWLALGQRTDSGYQTKGSLQRPVVEVGCRQGEAISRDRCRLGDRLLIRVDGLSLETFVAAWAQPAGGPVTWYYPDDPEGAPALRPLDDPQLVDPVVVLTPDHPTGDLALVIVLSSLPVTREEALARAAGGAGWVYRFNLNVQP